ncbi:MAG: YciI family protein [Comamonadaceae bacterium]|nr:MAG: YciI family protein [Comamonadaceae bacterium]
MVLVHADDNTEAAIDPGAARLGAMQQANEDSARAGILIAAEGLQPSSKGARVAFSGGKPAVIDGPFAEARELVAGFWMIQASTQADAVDWALRYPYPFKNNAIVDVRKVYEAADFGDAFTPELQVAEERMRAHLLESGKPLGAEP